MENKKIIIIGILAVILCILIGLLLGTLTKNVEYERIEIVSNGTSIEIPTDNATYNGEINETGCRQWTFKQGTLMTFNSEEAINARGLSGLGGALSIKEIKDLIINHFEKKETIDGFTVYTIDADTLNIDGRNTIYVIETSNETTHDNIIIATDNIDVTLHMAKSIQYKTADNIQNESDNMNNAPAEKTYPFYGDDGSIVGYYHVGDTIEYCDAILQLQSNGQWVQIGEATGSNSNGYDRGYNDAINDMNYEDEDYEDYYYDDDSYYQDSPSGGGY